MKRSSGVLSRYKAPFFRVCAFLLTFLLVLLCVLVCPAWPFWPVTESLPVLFLLPLSLLSFLLSPCCPLRPLQRDKYGSQAKYCLSNVIVLVFPFSTCHHVFFVCLFVCRFVLKLLIWKCVLRKEQADAESISGHTFKIFLGKEKKHKKNQHGRFLQSRYTGKCLQSEKVWIGSRKKERLKKDMNRVRKEGGGVVPFLCHLLPLFLCC